MSREYETTVWKWRRNTFTTNGLANFSENTSIQPMRLDANTDALSLSCNANTVIANMVVVNVPMIRSFTLGAAFHESKRLFESAPVHARW